VRAAQLRQAAWERRVLTAPGVREGFDDAVDELAALQPPAEMHIGSRLGHAALCGAAWDDDWRYGNPNMASCAVCLDLWRNRSWWRRLMNRVGFR